MITPIPLSLANPIQTSPSVVLSYWFNESPINRGACVLANFADSSPIVFYKSYLSLLLLNLRKFKRAKNSKNRIEFVIQENVKYQE